MASFEDIIKASLNDLKGDMKEQSKRLNALEKLEAANSANLANHMRRTEASEHRMETVENQLNQEMANVRTQLTEMKSDISKDIQSMRGTVIGWKANLHLLGWIVATGLSISFLLLRIFG